MDLSELVPVHGIDSFWESTRADAGRAERVLPTGRAQVVVDLDDGVATLVGPRTVSAVVKTPRHAMGFSLSGSGLSRIVGGDADDMVDSAVDLRDLGCDAQFVIDAECDRGALLRALAGGLVNRFEVDDRIVVAEHLLRSGCSAQSVTNQLGIDRRTFVPAFRRLVGLAPKHYELLVRFERTNNQLRRGVDSPLAAIACALGFADQAHMTRDVRRLAGCTPGQLQALAPGPANHLPVEASST